jgi:membrane dipeptidase
MARSSRLQESPPSSKTPGPTGAPERAHARKGGINTTEAEAEPSRRVSDESARLHDEAVVCDMVFVYEPEDHNDVRLFHRWIDSGVNFVSVHPAGDRHNIGEAMRRIARARRDILRDSRCIFVDCVDDIFRAKKEGKLAVGLHLEGFRCLERDLNMIEAYYRLGIRFCHPVFNLVNSIGGGAADRIDVGLTRFGIKVVHEMNRVGMIVDGSHAGYRTTMDMMEVSSAPVIFSHLGCNSIREHFRNARNDQIQACAAIGGVVGVTSAGFYLGGTSTETYFQHVDHIVQLVGAAKYVGIGLDYLDSPGVAFLRRLIDERPDEWPGKEQGAWEPMAFFSPEQLPELTELMLRHGYSEPAVRGILGENWVRVFREVWKQY